MKRLAVGIALGLVGLPAAAFAEPTMAGEAPCQYSEIDAGRINFVASYQRAHRAELAASCFNDAMISHLDRELQSISRKAQMRNPDVNLSTLDGETGLEPCRLSASDREAGCASTVTEAVRCYAAAMSELRSHTKKWR